MPFWQDPLVHQGMALLMLAALALTFFILLLRGILMKDNRTSQQPAAQNVDDYSGVGLKSQSEESRKEAVQES